MNKVKKYLTLSAPDSTAMKHVKNAIGYYRRLQDFLTDESDNWAESGDDRYYHYSTVIREDAEVRFYALKYFREVGEIDETMLPCIEDEELVESMRKMRDYYFVTTGEAMNELHWMFDYGLKTFGGTKEERAEKDKKDLEDLHTICVSVDRDEDKIRQEAFLVYRTYFPVIYKIVPGYHRNRLIWPEKEKKVG